MRVGIVLVGGGMLIIYAHIWLFWLLDGLIGIPLTIAALVLLDVLVVILIRWRDEIMLAFSPPSPAVKPLKGYDKRSLTFQRSDDADLARAAELLRSARHALHEQLLKYQDTDRRIVRIWSESLGFEFVRSSDSYLYLKRKTTVATGYDSYGDYREQVTTLACTWKVDTGRHGPVSIMLTINADARPQLLLNPGRRLYPGTPEGCQDLIDYLWRGL